MSAQGPTCRLEARPQIRVHPGDAVVERDDLDESEDGLDPGLTGGTVGE